MSRRRAQLSLVGALLFTDCALFPSLDGLTGSEADAGDAAHGGGDVTFDVFRNGQSVTAFAADDEHLYWTSGEAGTVTRMRHDGSGGPVPLANNQASPLAIAVRDELLYWTNEGVPLTNGSGAFLRNSGAIMRARPDGADRDVLVGGQNRPMGLAFEGGALYWSNHGAAEVDAAADGAIVTCGLPACDKVTSALTGERSPTHLMAANGSLIWTTLATPLERFAGRLRRFNLATRAVQDLAADVTSPTTLTPAPDGGALWWGDVHGAVHLEPLGAGSRRTWPVGGLPRAIAADSDHAFAALGALPGVDAAAAPPGAVAVIAQPSVSTALPGRTATAVLVHRGRLYVASGGDIYVARF